MSGFYEVRPCLPPVTFRSECHFITVNTQIHFIFCIFVLQYVNKFVQSQCFSERMKLMKSIGRTLLVVLLVVLVGVLGILIYGNYTENQRLAEEERLAIEAAQATPTPSLEPETFKEPENSANASLLFCGDLVCHTGLNSEAQKEDGTYDYAILFGDSVDMVKAADLAVCTLSTTLTNSGDYTGYPLFKSPVDLADSLKRTSFDVINTATAHCMDAGQEGLNFTLDVLDTNGLAHVGTYRSQEERNENDGIVVKDVNGITFAILSYTLSTGDSNIDDIDYAANVLYTDYDGARSEIDYVGLSLNMESARKLNTDMIIVMCQWGNEYDTAPTQDQKDLTDFFFKEGADIVIGGHTQSVEPMELRIVEDDDGTERTCFVAYSLGNYVSAQDEQFSNLTAALNIDVQKDLDTGETYLRNVSYTPLIMSDLLDYDITGFWRYRLRDIVKTMAAFKDGGDTQTVN
ncbi:MAG: CapA family protein, partial [Clostridia bacterium]|nr:CapA family protein [Clostridia bacterium]